MVRSISGKDIDDALIEKLGLNPRQKRELVRRGQLLREYQVQKGYGRQIDRGEFKKLLGEIGKAANLKRAQQWQLKKLAKPEGYRNLSTSIWSSKRPKTILPSTLKPKGLPEPLTSSGRAGLRKTSAPTGNLRRPKPVPPPASKPSAPPQAPRGGGLF